MNSLFIICTIIFIIGQVFTDEVVKIFATILSIEKCDEQTTIKGTVDNLEELNYLHGKILDYINRKSMKVVMFAHIDGG